MQSEVEESPMQRMLKQGNVGNGFQTDQHYKSMVYRVNVSGDNVRKWASDGTSGGTYAANELSVTEGIDENGVTTMIFTDKLGRTVLKRQEADETIGGTSYDWFDTYFVYDLLGNISFVVPPKAVARMDYINTWNVTSVPELIFSYKYDHKNRVTEKKVPGASVVYIVYDPLDRPLLTQNGTMRAANTWFYSKYDASGRVIIEGVYTNSTYTSLSTMQAYVNGQADYGSSSTTYYEERTSATFSYYTNQCFPETGTEERLYYYYDSYDIDNDGYADAGYASQSLPGEGTATDKVLGLAVCSRVKKLGSSDWSINTTMFDKRYNAIQTTSTGYYSNYIITAVTDFGGRLNERKEYHSFSHLVPTLTIRNSYTYDKMNRLTEVKQGHNGGTMIIVARYEYNPLGQLVDKKLHSTNSGSSFLQSVDYRYNIRGQLRSINNSTLTNDGVLNDETNDVWGMRLFYERTDADEDGSDVTIGNTANWTGMLSGVKWKASIAGGNNDQRGYLFTYDKLYRLTTATYKAMNAGGTAWTKDVNGFNEAMTYEWNGNILTMQRNAVISGSVTAIDNLSYSYDSNNDNNKLLNITESSSNSYGYRNFTSSGSGYTYDVNGNLTVDAKKGTTITYNELNKPVLIEQTSTGLDYVSFEYDAAGTRVSKTVYSGFTTTTEYYIGGLVIDGSKVVKHFAMAEGRVRNNSGTLVYEYFITDHQGNVRISFEDNGSGTAVARQENSYYPYGMLMTGNYMPSSPNKRLYNAGSEWQDDHGGIIDYYSTFFREYDPILGRFNGVDVLAESDISLTVFGYAGCNPINYNDPWGASKAGPGDDPWPDDPAGLWKWGGGSASISSLLGSSFRVSRANWDAILYSLQQNLGIRLGAGDLGTIDGNNLPRLYRGENEGKPGPGRGVWYKQGNDYVYLGHANSNHIPKDAIFIGRSASITTVSYRGNFLAEISLNANGTASFSGPLYESGGFSYESYNGVLQINAQFASGGMIYAIDDFTPDNVQGEYGPWIIYQNSTYVLFFSERKTFSNGKTYWVDRRTGKIGPHIMDWEVDRRSLTNKYIRYILGEMFTTSDDMWPPSYSPVR